MNQHIIRPKTNRVEFKIPDAVLVANERDIRCHVLFVIPNYWGRSSGKSDTAIKMARDECLKQGGYASLAAAMRRGPKFMVVWVIQERGVAAPFVDGMGGIMCHESARCISSTFEWRANGRAVLLGTEDTKP